MTTPPSFLARTLGAVIVSAALVACSPAGNGPAGAGAASGAAATTANKPASFHAVDLTGADYAHDFHLSDPAGQPRTLKDYAGKDVVVFFGYTHCPDACPTMLADLSAAKKAMGPDGGKVQVVFVTVDPERDTPDLMKAYAANFGSDVVGLRGDEAATKAVAREFKVFYVKVPGKTADDYTIDHSAGAYVFDPKGRLRLFIRNGSTPETMAEDFSALLRERA